MGNPSNKTWEIAREAIRVCVTEENFSTYFKPLRFMEARGDEVVLAVDDSFFGDWVRTHYLELIESQLTKAAGRKVTLVIEVSEKPAIERKPLAAMTRPAQRSQPNRQNEELALNPNYIFENFVVGPSNDMAHAASIAVAQEPARTFNPLFLYGETGLGKTHLLQGIARDIRKKWPEKRIVYVSGEEFTNQVIRSIQLREMDDFRAQYRRDCDVLLVDDVHVLAGKERTQEEFFYTFNALHTAQKQIVLTSDRTPQEIQRLEARLRSRFQWGLITDIRPPSFETRVAILQRKAERDRIALPHDVAQYLAQLVNTNIRELEGALVRLAAFAGFHRKPLTIEFAEQALQGIVEKVNDGVSVTDIIDLVADYFAVADTEIIGRRRHRAIAHPRSMAMYLCRKHTECSFPQIGRDFGGKDHTTVMAACKKISQAVETDARIRKQIEQLERKLPHA